MTARRHHYIPQFYLKGFCEDPKSPRLFVVDTEESKSFYTTPANVALEMDFHTIENPAQRKDIVETELAKLESDISLAIARIVSDRSLSNEDDLVLLLTLMAAILIKNPGMRKRVSDSFGAAQMMLMKARASDPRQWAAYIDDAKQDGTIREGADAEALRQMILEDRFHIDVSTSGHLMLEFGNLPSIIEMLSHRQWMLFKARSDKAGFVTTDNPVTLSWFDRENAVYSPGLGLRGTQLIFPVSNNLAVVGTFEYPSATFDADDDTLAKINGNIILSHNRQIYARDATFTYQLKCHPQPQYGDRLAEDSAINNRGGDAAL